MAILFIRETTQGRGGVFEHTKGTAKRTFRVLTDNQEDGPVLVANAIRDHLPNHSPIGERIVIGSPHPEWEMMRAQVVSADQIGDDDDTPFDWLVTVNYSSEIQRRENPLDEPIIVDWDSDQFQEPFLRDRNNQTSNVDSAGIPLDPPPEKDASRRVVRIEKNLAVVPTWIIDYEDAVNDAAFVLDGVPIGQEIAKINKVHVSPEQLRNDIVFRTVTILMQFKRDKWTKRLLDAGFFRKHPTDATKRIPIRFHPIDGSLLDPDHGLWDDGVEPVAPWPLDGDGNAIENPSFSNVVTLPREPYVLRDYSALPLV